MNSFYVVGGQQRDLRTLFAEQQWYSYQKGLVLRVNVETSTAETCVEYVSPPEVYSEEHPAILFKSSTVVGNKMYACTQTELLVYELPSFKQIGYLSLPFFNDLHHVRPSPAGNLLVANSGLEMVLEISLEGEVIQQWNVLGEPIDYDPHVDYRKINTKPHRAHPNHVFYVDNDIWATRFEQRDAICLTQAGKRIIIGTERVHDGLFHNGFVYFTTVDGRVVIANPYTTVVEEVINLNAMHQEDALLGWCRSVLVEDSKLWVGFSRIRATKIRENVGWVSRGFKRGMPTHFACYDLEQKRCVREIDVEPMGLNAIFSLHAADTAP